MARHNDYMNAVPVEVVPSLATPGTAFTIEKEARAMNVEDMLEEFRVATIDWMRAHDAWAATEPGTADSNHLERELHKAIGRYVSAEDRIVSAFEDGAHNG
jgi:hypothetical protein